MDDDHSSPDWHGIISKLCLEAGRLMENASVDLARTMPRDVLARADRLGQTQAAADDCLSLLAAAQVLHRRCLGETDQA
jgi:hypothetical protein